MQSPNYGLIVGYEDCTILCNCRFVVNEKSRQRVLRERSKNVHAWVVGHGVDVKSFNFDMDKLRPSYYNPYEVNSFIDLETNKKVDEASVVVFHRDFRVSYM
jgi:hypothetical protein